MKKLVFSLVLILGITTSIEVLSFGVYALVYKKMFSLSQLRTDRQRIIAEAGEAQNTDGQTPTHHIRERYVLHPYTGFVLNGSLPQHNEWGLSGEENIFYNNTHDATIVLTGGSVAHGFYVYGGRQILLRYFQQLPVFQDKTIHFISLAVPGHKQPQQLLAVAYYLALGGRLDILINIDGFNEVVGPVNNLNLGIFPAYPMSTHWLPLTENISSLGYLKTVGMIDFVRDLRRRFARGFEYLRYSVTANVLWCFIDASLGHRIARSQIELQTFLVKNKETLPYFRSGPRARVRKEDAYQFAINLWLNASLQLRKLASVEQFTYFHFLQPNQYVAPATKVFTQQELDVFTKAWPPLIQQVKTGYPLLLVAGEKLEAQGVLFHNLTQIYKDIEDTVYLDPCCHLNQRGNEIMAYEIGRIVTQYFEAQPQLKTK